VQVSVCRLLKVAEKGKPETGSEISPQHRLVEVTCRVADGEYGLGAEVIGEPLAAISSADASEVVTIVSFYSYTA